MKMNNRLILALALGLSVSVISCKKTDKTDTTNSDKTTELTTHSDDQSRVSNESDAVANDANTVADATPAFGGRLMNASNGTTAGICDASTMVDSTATDRRITITYNGTNCSGTRTRTGVVVLTMPLAMHWHDAGAVLTVNYQNLKITRLSDNKSITINGMETVTNTSGGRLYELAALGTIVHDLASSGMSITFDNGTQRTWQMSKHRVFTYDNGIVISTTGTHTDGATTNISEWGTNRFGNAFVTSITQPMVIREDCSFRLTSGQVTHQRLSATVVCTFGLDASGNPTSCPALGAYYYYRIVWTGANGAVVTLIHPY